MPEVTITARVAVGDAGVDLNLTELSPAQAFAVISGVAAGLRRELPIAGLSRNCTPRLPPPKPKAPRPASSDAGVGGGIHTCDVCGHAAKTLNGLGVHRARKHPTAPAKTPAAAATIASTPAADEDKPMLRCNDCVFTVDTASFAKLRSHTMSQHGGRLPSSRESTPRTAAQADEASA